MIIMLDKEEYTDVTSISKVIEVSESTGFR